MRVLVAVPRFPVLSQTFIIRHLRGLIERGVETWVLSVPADTNLLASDPVMEPLLSERMLKLDPLIGEWELLGRGVLALPWRLASIKLVGMFAKDRLAKRDGLQSRQVFSAASRMRRAPQFDVIHAQHGQAAYMIARLMDAGFIKTPLIATFHGSDLNVERSTTNPVLYDSVWRNASLCTAGSEYMHRHLLEAGIEEERRRIVPMGIDTRVWSPTAGVQSESPSLPPRLVSVGRLIEWKGIEYALRAVGVLADRGVEVRYEIIGHGPLRESLQSLVEELGLNDCVTFAGALSPEEVRQRMEMAMVMVHPGIVDSQGGQEGQGVVLAEAQALELPVVTTRVGGIPGSIREGVTGLLVEQRDPHALADAIADLISSPEQARAMGVAGRQFVIEKFDHERIMDGWVRTYEEITASGFSQRGSSP